jgi:hypothetical protein
MEESKGERAWAVLGVLGMTGVLPAVACWLAEPVVDAVPGWAFVAVFCGALLAAAAWLMRGAL